MEETLKQLRAELEPLYGKGESEAIIRLIFHYVKGWNLTDMLIHSQDELSTFVKKEIARILARLKNYEPIQYITGEARFHGMEFIVRPGVLIPRQETDELVDIIIEENREKEDLKVLDLCTGSGCIAIALARNLPFPKVTALDISDEALDVARENAKKLKTDVGIVKGDVLEGDIPGNGSQGRGETGKTWDIIVSNPPYVLDKEAMDMERNVLDYEPHEALFVRDDDPLAFYRNIGDYASRGLKEGGRLYFEINPLTSAELKKLLESKGFEDIRILKDSHGKDRFACAKRK